MTYFITLHFPLYMYGIFFVDYMSFDIYIYMYIFKYHKIPIKACYKFITVSHKTYQTSDIKLQTIVATGFLTNIK